MIENIGLCEEGLGGRVEGDFHVSFHRFLPYSQGVTISVEGVEAYSVMPRGNAFFFAYSLYIASISDA